MKKIFCFLVSVIMIITMMPQAIGASSVKWQDKTANLNESFSIIVEGEDIAVGKSIGIWVNYDDTVLQCEGAEWLAPGSPVLQDWSVTSAENTNLSKQEGVLAYTREHSFNGQLLRLDFKVIGVPAGDPDITAIEISCVVKNGTSEILNTTVSGNVTVLHTHKASTWYYENAEKHIATCIHCKDEMQETHSFVELGYDAVVRANIQYCSPCRTQEFYVRCGDIDRSGSIESSDARSILRFAVSLDTPDAQQILLSDATGDGIISSEDARITLRTAVSLEDIDNLRIYKTGELPDV